MRLAFARGLRFQVPLGPPVSGIAFFAALAAWPA